MQRFAMILTGGLVLVGGVGAFVFFGNERTNGLLDPDDRQLVALGAEIYAAECASCHGANLEGQGNWRVRGDDGLLPAPPHDASGHTWHHDDETLLKLTKYGLAGLMENAPASGMPAYDGILSDEEIIATLSYIKSTWPEEIRARHDDINARAEP